MSSKKSVDLDDVIVIAVQKARLGVLLDEALASWRAPRVDMVSAAGILLTFFIGLSQSRTDPITIGVGSLFVGLIIGLIIGRMLRPKPSGEHLQKFSKEISEAGHITNLISDSAQYSKKIDVLMKDAGISVPVPNFEFETPFAIVDAHAFYQIKELASSLCVVIGSDDFSQSIPKTIRSNSFCIECAKKNKINENFEQCYSCKSFYCSDCVSRGGLTKGSDGFYRCRSCQI